MDKAEGLIQIDQAEWVKDEYDSLNLKVTHPRGTVVHCILSLRPFYCDRGHIQLLIEAPYIELDEADSFPRFFFSFNEADKHVREFLKWRLWKYRIHLHILEVTN